MGMVLRYLWASPNTLLGLLVGIFMFSKPRRAGGVLLFESGWGPVVWVMRKAKTGAVCLGHVIVSRVPVEGRVLRHEMVHVRQYERLGPAFIPLYVYQCLRHGLINPLEREAYEGQDDWTGRVRGGRIDE